MFSGDAERRLRRARGRGREGRRAGAIPVVLGGDHTDHLAGRHRGGARAAAGAGSSIIHFDAHADTGDIEFGSLIGHGQPMRRLIESGAVRGDRFLQIGLRGYWPPPESLDWMAAAGHALARDDRDRRTAGSTSA